MTSEYINSVGKLVIFASILSPLNAPFDFHVRFMKAYEVLAFKLSATMYI